MAKEYKVHIKNTETGKHDIVTVTGDDAMEVGEKLNRMSRGGDTEVVGGVEVTPAMPDPLENGEY